MYIDNKAVIDPLLKNLAKEDKISITAGESGDIISLKSDGH